MLCPSENPPASLDIFSQPHHHPSCLASIARFFLLFLSYTQYSQANPSNPWQNRRIYPLAYCPPGRGFSLGSNPRALPPVTQSSALQAPERMWILLLKTSNPWQNRNPEDGSPSHQAKDIVVAPGEPFCTANGSHFVFWGLRRSCKARLGVAA